MSGCCSATLRFSDLDHLQDLQLPFSVTHWWFMFHSFPAASSVYGGIVEHLICHYIVFSINLITCSIKATSTTLLDYAYKRESDANVRERILLVRRIISDGQDMVLVSKEELHRSRAWAYKWLKRFDKEGVEGLKDRPRSGRPPDVPEEKLSKIRSFNLNIVKYLMRESANLC